MLFFNALVVALLIATAIAIEPLSRHRSRSFFKAPLVSLSGNFTDPTRWLTQRLDHFESNNATWNQRYFVNDTLFDGTGPVFLCVGGEGPGFTTDVVVTGTVHAADMIEAAKMHGALILALEHRYYGESIPTNNFSTSNLKWLSSQQALADLAVFVGYINDKYNLTKDNKWITWGGSYPGMMASFARLKYPHLIHGAVASSAPVMAISNMEGYNDVTAESMAASSVGGSVQCAEAIKEAFEILGKLLLSGPKGWIELETKFNICNSNSYDSNHPLEDPLNQLTFSNDLGLIFPVQGNDPGCTSIGCNISSICLNFMTNSTYGNPLDRLATFNNYLSKMYNEECTPVDYKNAVVTPMTDISLERGTSRVWEWQTCTEYGFYQTCDPTSKCLFTSNPHQNTLTSNINVCRLAFGDRFSNFNVNQSVKFSNLWSGGRTPGVSRVMYVNGEIDPWHAQSIIPKNGVYGTLVNVGESGQDLSALMVKGASHHYWTHANGVQSKEIVEAKRIIFRKISEWLSVKA